MEQCVCKLRWHLACRSSLPSNWRLMTFKLGGTCVPRSRFGRRVAVSNRAFAKTLLPISRLSRRNFSRKVYGPSFLAERKTSLDSGCSLQAGTGRKNTAVVKQEKRDAWTNAAPRSDALNQTDPVERVV